MSKVSCKFRLPKNLLNSVCSMLKSFIDALTNIEKSLLIKLNSMSQDSKTMMNVTEISQDIFKISNFSHAFIDASNFITILSETIDTDVLFKQLESSDKSFFIDESGFCSIRNILNKTAVPHLKRLFTKNFETYFKKKCVVN